MMQEKSYTQTYQMLAGDGDCLGNVKVSTLIRYAQQVATDHATQMGLTEAFYREHQMVFLLAKQGIAINRIPRTNETLTFVTTPEQAKRVSFKRVTFVYDEQGQEIAGIDSRWVLVDTVTRKIMRRPPLPFDHEWTEEVPYEVDLRCPKANTLQEAGGVTARYSICDRNGHINNANYFDIALDCFPNELWQQKTLKRAVVNYHREARLGEVIQLQMEQTEEGIYLIGRKNDGISFEFFGLF